MTRFKTTLQSTILDKEKIRKVTSKTIRKLYYYLENKYNISLTIGFLFK